jgi:MFS family permease
MKHALTRFLETARRSLLADRNFRLMWLSSTITNFGGQVTLLAMPLTAITLLNATPTQMGILGALEAIPFTLFSLHSGVYIDRMKKLPIILACELLIAASLIALPIAFACGLLTMTVLYVVSFLLGCAFVVVGTAGQVFLTHIAGRERLIEANSLFTLSDSGSRLTGPGVAGALIQLLGAPIAILADCAGFIASIVMLVRIDTSEEIPTAAEHRPMLRDIGEGIRLVWRHPILRTLMVCASLWMLFFQGYATLATLFASRELGLSAGRIGAAHMLAGLGALLAATVAPRVTRRLGMGTPVTLGMFSCGLAWILFAHIAPGKHAFAQMGAALFFLDFGATLYWINYSTLRQSVTPDALLGRMTATMRFFTVALAPLGAYGAGLLGETIGLRATLTLGGLAVVLLAVCAFAFTSLRRITDLSQPGARAAAAALANSL